MNATQDGSVYQRGSIWWIRYQKEGKRQFESSGSSNKLDADRLLKKRLSEVVTQKPVAAAGVTMSDLFGLVVADYEDNAKASISEVRSKLRLYLTPMFGSVPAEKFGSLHVTQYKAKRRSEGASNATLNREFSVVRRALKLATIAEPPILTHIPKIPLLAEDNVREGFLEISEYQSLLKELPSYLKCLFVVAYHTGMRKGELVSLKWTQVDLGFREITRTPAAASSTKKKGVSIKLYGDMDTYLTLQKQDHDANQPDCPWVFYDAQGHQILSFRKAWASACKRAGVSCLFHDLRRSGVRNMIRAGVPEKVAMANSGHKTSSIFGRYNITSQTDMDMVAEKMSRFLGVPETPAEKPRLVISRPKVKPVEQLPPVRKGYHYDAKRGKWCAQISIGGKQHNLGRFATEEEAAGAYAEAAAEKAKVG